MDPLDDQRSMQSLLNSTPEEEDYDTVQQPCDVNGVCLSDHPQMSCNAWTTPYPHALREKIEVLGKLQMPPGEIANQSTMTPMTRFLDAEPPSRPIMLFDASSSTNSEFLGHHPNFAIAVSYQGSHEDSLYTNSIDETIWTKSQDSLSFDYPPGDASPTSALCYDNSCGGGHSHRSSMDGCLPFPSPGSGSNCLDQGGASTYYTDLSSGNCNPGVAPGVMIDEISQRSFVNPQNIELTHTNENRDDDDAAEEGLSDRMLENHSIPDIRLHGPEWDSTNSWPDEQGRYHMQAPMEIECSSHTHYPQSHSSPQPTAEPRVREEQRSRSISRASQISPKARAEMMKPASKNHKGRGAGKKRKQWICPHHPSRVFKHNSDYRKHMQTQHTRPFYCTFHFAGCAQTFGSKNEWKRHVFSQHLRLQYWRCDHMDCADRDAIFGRKDLFGQHMKRMHSPKPSLSKNSQQMKDFLGKEIPKTQERCEHVRRLPPPRAHCGYCNEKFEGEGSWNRRMEHVGKHYERTSGKEKIDPNTWVLDQNLIKWAIEEKIIKLEDEKYKLLPSGKASIEEEEKRKNSIETMDSVMDDDDEMDAEGELDS